ncbi:hypothetical protein E2C01_050450 [Portunus trituberculatus]|uniref:Retrotransposon gag domain-containing protein n=1 Tax=Portunus trituberculatus TaxID=210409 RepID=A0A5B7GG58_PORTR|nr:hypothetical protein [Portunus trituberculatus]
MAQAKQNQTVKLVPKFSGEPNTIEVNQFIRIIDTLIAKIGINSEKLKIEFLKLNIDSEKGRARYIIGYGQMEDITSYQEYIDTFRRHFMNWTDLDPLRAMVKFLNMDKTPCENFKEYIAKLDLWIINMEYTLKHSAWKTQGTKIDGILKIDSEC